MSSKLQEEYLAHYGVPGMKWGHRRARFANSEMTPEERKAYRKERAKRILKGVGIGLGAAAATAGAVVGARALYKRKKESDAKAARVARTRLSELYKSGARSTGSQFNRARVNHVGDKLVYKNNSRAKGLVGKAMKVPTYSGYSGSGKFNPVSISRNTVSRTPNGGIRIKQAEYNRSALQEYLKRRKRG